jgi:RNA polymerase sigma factor (sigma-70 family)
VNVFRHHNNAIAVLSIRENEILNLLSQGLLYKEIADSLNITVGTVSQHVHNIYEKLHVQNRTEAINKLLGRQ